MKTMLLYRSKSGMQDVAYRPGFTPDGIGEIEGPGGSLFLFGDFVSLNFPAAEAGHHWREEAGRLLADVARVVEGYLYDANGCFVLVAPLATARDANRLGNLAEAACRPGGPDHAGQEGRMAQLWRAGLAEPTRHVDHADRDIFSVARNWATPQYHGQLVLSIEGSPVENEKGRKFAFVLLRYEDGTEDGWRKLPADWPGVAKLLRAAEQVKQHAATEAAV